MRNEEIWEISEDKWISVTLDKCLENQQRKTLIFCHGLTGDKIGPQRLLSDLSAYLTTCCKKIEIVRFDFQGAGLSSGSFTNTSLDSMCEDALWVASQCENPIIWAGLSTGALIALMAAAKRKKKEDVVGISNGFAEIVRFLDIDKEYIPIRGGQLFLSKKYFTDRALLSPRKKYFSQVGTVTSILGSRDKKHFEEWRTLQDAGAKIRIIDDGDHLFTEPEKRKELFHCLGELICAAV